MLNPSCIVLVMTAAAEAHDGIHAIRRKPGSLLAAGLADLPRAFCRGGAAPASFYSIAMWLG